MKKIVFAIILLLGFYVRGQEMEKEKQEVLAEAWLMYNSERASWLGSDLFMQRFPERMAKAGGYFSYTDAADKKHKCIFYDRSATPKAIASFIFDDSFVTEASVADTLSRSFTAFEKDLYTIRKAALEESLKDTLFKRYEKASLNLVPIIINGKKKVYFLTGPTEGGVVIFGNDYVVEFDRSGKIKAKKQLHKNMIPINYAKNKEDEVTTMHTHLESTGELITATDVCTLLLYGPYAGWSQHYVFSPKYVSLWDCNKESLMVITRKAWDRITEHQNNKKQ